MCNFIEKQSNHPSKQEDSQRVNRLYRTAGHMYVRRTFQDSGVLLPKHRQKVGHQSGRAQDEPDSLATIDTSTGANRHSFFSIWYVCMCLCTILLDIWLNEFLNGTGTPTVHILKKCRKEEEEQ